MTTGICSCDLGVTVPTDPANTNRIACEARKNQYPKLIDGGKGVGMFGGTEKRHLLCKAVGKPATKPEAASLAVSTFPTALPAACSDSFPYKIPLL